MFIICMMVRFTSGNCKDVRMNKAMAQNHRFLLKNYIKNTTPKFNIKPENGHFPKGSPFPGCNFQCTSTKMVDVHRFRFPMID